MSYAPPTVARFPLSLHPTGKSQSSPPVGAVKLLEGTSFLKAQDGKDAPRMRLGSAPSVGYASAWDRKVSCNRFRALRKVCSPNIKARSKQSQRKCSQRHH